MKNTDIRKIRKSMEKSLEEKRYEHTLGVAYTAAALAMCHGASVESAELAGLLHDCAKGMDEEKVYPSVKSTILVLQMWNVENHSFSMQK